MTDFKSSLSWQTPLKYKFSKFSPNLSESSSEKIPTYFRTAPLLSQICGKQKNYIIYCKVNKQLFVFLRDDSYLLLAHEFKNVTRLPTSRQVIKRRTRKIQSRDKQEFLPIIFTRKKKKELLFSEDTISSAKKGKKSSKFKC